MVSTDTEDKVAFGIGTDPIDEFVNFTSIIHGASIVFKKGAKGEPIIEYLVVLGEAEVRELVRGIHDKKGWTVRIRRVVGGEDALEGLITLAKVLTDDGVRRGIRGEHAVGL